MIRFLLLTSVVLCSSFNSLLIAEKPTEPNVVFFLVDDLGWADVGVNGSSFYETPHIDALANSGMNFTQAYAACPVCSPTRASILTGRHPVRVEITDWIPGMRAKPTMKPKFQHIDDRDDLALEEITIAEVLHDSGYRTFFAGKWHLGSEGYLPTDQGFDINIGGMHKGSPPGGYFGPWKNPYLKAKRKGEYLTERLTEESIEFIRSQDKKSPFFLYLSYYNVHTPIQANPKRLPHYQKKAKQFGKPSSPIQEHDGQSRSRQDNPAYASMVAAVDDSVGAIMSALKEQGIEKDTIVIFFSDNGGLCTKPTPGPTSNLPLRAGKGWLYEGGIREPMIIRAPNVTPPGSTCNTPVVSMDFFPTILELTNQKQRPKLHNDGISLVPLLTQQPLKHAPIYWHYPHYHGSTWKPGAAVRDGDWKLIAFYEQDKYELYHLANDPGEQHDLAKTNPDKTRELKQQLSNWQAKMKAKMPVRFDEE